MKLANPNQPISDVEHAINLLYEEGLTPTASLLAERGIDYSESMQRGEVESYCVRSLRLYAIGPTRTTFSRRHQMHENWDHEEGSYSVIAGPSCTHPILAHFSVRECPDCKTQLALL